MAVTGDEGGFISSEQAEEWINNFQETYPEEIFAHLVGKNKLASVVQQQGCLGIRIYNGVDSSGVKKIIIYGVDANGDGLTNYILDQAQPCPPYCGRP